MASRFLSSQREELGSGGKVLRGRRLLPSLLPYSRPSSSAGLMPRQAAEAQTGRSPSWLRGLISGVGNLLLSTLGSERCGSPPSECFSNNSSDEYYDYSPNEHDDQLLSDDLTAFKMRECKVERNVESLAIVPKSETKHVIEQLLMQETFTRDECNKLIEIIQTRVLGITSAEIGEGTQNVLPTMVTNKGQSLNQKRNLSGTSKFSPSILSSFSPIFYACEAVSPDIRNKAVVEAKKWFEEKKLSPSSTYDRECEPCISNTHMNQYGFERDCGSPIEIAKSYMQSLPPWKSPSFSNIGLMTPPPSWKSTNNFGSRLLPTVEAKKKDYLAIGSLNTEENHRTYLKSLDNEQEFSELGQSKLLSKLSVYEASTIPSAAAKTCNEVRDIFSDKCLNLHDGKAAEVGQLMETDNEVSVGAILQSKEAFKELPERPEAAAANIIDHLHYDIASMLPNDADMSASDVNQNMERPLPTEEQIGSISAQDSLVLAPIAGRNNGDSFPETETLQLENITSAEPSIPKNSGDEVMLQDNNSIQVNLDSGFKNTHPITDTEPPDGNPRIPEEAIEPSAKLEANRHFTEVNNMKSDLESMSKGDPTTTNSGHGGSAASSDVSVVIPRTRRASRNASKTQKSIEGMLTKPHEPSRGKRKAKKVVRQKRGRG